MYDNIITKELENAAERSFRSLFENTGEKFYYCSLIMSEECTPFISAWSEEALERLMLQMQIKENDYETKNEIYRWSYADSPYCAYGFDDYFQNVDKLFQKRLSTSLSDDEYIMELEIWINSMEEAMRILDYKGLFGNGKARKSVLINAEIMPSDDSTIDRTRRLNPKIIFDQWLKCTLQDEIMELDFSSIWHPKLCNVILIRKIPDQKKMLKLKSIFYYDGELKSFIQGCENPPFMIKEKALLDSVSEALRNNPEIQELIKIETT